MNRDELLIAIREARHVYAEVHLNHGRTYIRTAIVRINKADLHKQIEDLAPSETISVYWDGRDLRLV